MLNVILVARPVKLSQRSRIGMAVCHVAAQEVPRGEFCKVIINLHKKFV